MPKDVIPYARQSIDDDDIAAVVAILRSEYLTQGPAVERFEDAVAAFCGAPYAVAVANATSALIVAMRALDVGPGSRVWTSPNSFVASANCAVVCGAEIDFVDIETGTWNMSAAALETKLIAAERAGTLPHVIIPVHFAGQPCDMPAIGALARRYGVRVVEDASHAIGSTIAGARTGACAHADAVVFSFHPVKIVTTGEGGMLVTRDPELAERARRLRSHGITRDPARMTAGDEGPWYYEQVELGYNLRLTDLQAALGTSQLARIDRFVARRRELAASYDAQLAETGLTLSRERRGARSSYHLYVVHVGGSDPAARRRALFAAFAGNGIRANVHYIPIHLQPFYRARGFARGDFPVAETYYAGCLSLPMYVGLRDDEQQRVVEVVHDARHFA
jgi:UDP-4-amino-4,6-dideoxy-N-acetyl-beta-L-altrosamine transaminase